MCLIGRVSVHIASLEEDYSASEISLRWRALRPGSGQASPFVKGGLREIFPARVRVQAGVSGAHSSRAWPSGSEK